MSKVLKLGSIGCFVASPAKFHNKSFLFDGTTLNLIREAYKLGARAGDIIEANYGFGFRSYELEAAPHDDRAFKLWIK